MAKSIQSFSKLSFRLWVFWLFDYYTDQPFPYYSDVTIFVCFFMLGHDEKAKLFLFILGVQTHSVTKCIMPTVMKPVFNIEDGILG